MIKTAIPILCFTLSMENFNSDDICSEYETHEHVNDIFLQEFCSEVFIESIFNVKAAIIDL